MHKNTSARLEKVEKGDSTVTVTFLTGKEANA
jgi:hypothetical protein